MRINSTKEFVIKSRSLTEIKKLNLQKIGLNKLNNSNIFVYHSNVFKILNYKIKSDINFSISFKDNKIYIELIKIKGMPDFLKRIITINIKVDISQEGDICIAKRFISLNLKNERKIVKIFSDKLVKKLLFKALEKISKRFDKKFLNKVLN